MIDVSIIIVNYNTIELLKNCLNSIKNNTKNINYEIIVVDNNSTDGSTEVIECEYSNVILIKNNCNMGFGKANNIGVDKSNGKYCLFLNSDTLLLNNAVKEFHTYFEANKNKKNIGALGAWLINKDGEVIHSYEKFPSMIYYIKRKIKQFLSYDKFKNKFFVSNNSVVYNNEKCLNVDYITGADLFMERELFIKLGGFNKSFFMYFEETELEYRILKMGKSRIIINTPKIIHLEGKSSTYNKKRIMFDRSMITYFRLTHNKGSYYIFKFIYFILELLCIIKSTILRNEYTFNENIKYIRSYIKF